MNNWSEMVKRGGRPPEMVDIVAKKLEANWAAYMGPRFLGLIALTFMMGVLAIQATNYFSTFGFESIWLFSLVVSCILLSMWVPSMFGCSNARESMDDDSGSPSAEWLTVAIAVWDCFGNWRRLAAVPWEDVALPLTSGLTVFTSQLFFASRCYTLYGRSKLVFGALLLGMTACLGLFVFFAAVVAVDPFNVPVLEKSSISSIVMNVDVAITGLMLWKLGRGREMYSPQTQRGLQRLRNLTAETAVPPTISMILNIGSFLIMVSGGLAGKHNQISAWFAIITPILYVWSMMFTLNSRVVIRQTFNAPNSGEDEARSTGFRFVNHEAVDSNSGHEDNISLERVGGRVHPREGLSSKATLDEAVA